MATEEHLPTPAPTLASSESSRQFLEVVRNKDDVRAFDLLLHNSNRLRGYLLMRFEGYLQGPIGVEVVVIDAIIQALQRAGEFEPEAEEKLGFWLFRTGIEIAQRAMESGSVSGGAEADGRERDLLGAAIEGLAEPCRTIARIDYRHGGRAPLALLAREVGADEETLFRLRGEARAALQGGGGQPVTARTHQFWYHTVARCNIGPDLAPLTRLEAREEYERAPREGVGRLEDVFRTNVDRSGLTTALVSALRQGSNEALQRLIVRFQPRMEEIVHKMTGARKSSADDVLQEVNLKLVEDGLANFVPRGHGFLLRYLHVILRNEIRVQGRRKPNYKMLLPEELEDLVVQEDPEESGWGLDRLGVWLDQLQEINPKWCEVIQLRRERLSYREIAARLGKSEGAVSQRITRAMSALTTLAHRDRRSLE